jgi:phospholipid/cholesterol/gamma-HCH transport system substrate-binding protein
MTPPSSHEGGLSVRDQIERYRTAFLAVVTMIVIAAIVGGYILAHENLKLPTWVPVLGKSYFTLRAEFQTAQAVTPGQGQAVTIAGAKIGEIASVDLQNGVATVTMHLTPKYARLYRDATLLLRPKTQLKDMTVEVNPGTPSAGKLQSGATLSLSQTAPDVNFDEFLAGLDAETRAYLQELLAGAGQGLGHNGRALAAALKRFYPTTRYTQLITRELQKRHTNIARSIHNFRLLTEALGSKDKQLADLVQSANAVFATFAQEERSVQRTLKLLPGALAKTRTGLGKLGTAARVLGPTLAELQPTARALAPAEEASRPFFRQTTPVIAHQIRPFARQILPVINQVQPTTQQLSESLPKLAQSFSVLNELFNELAYNPGRGKGGFLFFTDWAAHNLNAVVSAADAHGVLGRSLLYLNCEVLPLLAPTAKINPTVNIITGLLNPPSRAACQSAGILKGATPASARGRVKPPPGGLFSGLDQNPFGHTPSATAGAARLGGAGTAHPGTAHPGTTGAHASSATAAASRAATTRSAAHGGGR